MKRKPSDIVESLEAMGQDSEEKAAKWVIEENQRIDREKEKAFNNTLQIFDKKRKTFRGYYEALANQLRILLDHYVDWRDSGFTYEATFNLERGVGVLIKDPLGRTYGRGFKPNGEPKYDLHAIKVLIWQTENVVDDYFKEKEIRDQKTGTN